MYCRVPDPEIALTRKGHQQARAASRGARFAHHTPSAHVLTRRSALLPQAAEAGRRIKEICDADGKPYKLFFYISPYKRSKQARTQHGGLSGSQGLHATFDHC